MPKNRILLALALCLGAAACARPDDRLVVRSQGVREELDDSLVKAITARVDTLNTDLIKFSSTAIARLDTASVGVVSVTAQFELGSVGELMLTLQSDSTADDNAELWTFVDSADASTRVVLARVNSTFSGQVWKDGELYRIEQAAGDYYLLRKVEQGGRLPEKAPRRPTANEKAKAKTRPRADARASDECKTPALITLLVGVPASDTAALGGFSRVKADVSVVVKTINSALYENHLAHRVRLLPVVVTHGETNALLDTALTRLEDPDDKQFDDLLQERDRLHADVTVLWVRRATDACGLAYVIRDFASESSLALITVDAICAFEGLSLAHELGHTLGVEHDRANATAAAPWLPFAFGFQMPSKKGRDIMAYDCPSGCPRVPMYSSPRAMWKGEPLGVSSADPVHSADAASAIAASACSVAKFR